MSNLLDSIKNEKRVTAKLSDYIKIKHGFAFKGEYFSNHPTKEVLVTPGNFAIGGGFKDEKYKYYAGSVPEDYILKPGDLVVTMTDLSVNADTLGYSAIIPRKDDIEFLHNQRIGFIQEIEKGIDMGFLHYAMRTREYHSFILGSASGSTVRHTSPDRITSYEYAFPSLPTQKKIAEILSAFDKKIEINNVIIENLEETAQEIFDEWFVKFRFPGFERAEYVESDMGEIPAGWEVKKIGDIIELVYGKALKEEDRVPGEYDVVGSSGIVGKHNVKIVTGPGIVVGRKGNAGSIIWVDKDFYPIDTTFFVRSELPMLYCLFLLKKQTFQSGDSAVPGLNRDAACMNSVIVAKDDIISSFIEFVGPCFEKKSALEKENYILKASRDKLLTELV